MSFSGRDWNNNISKGKAFYIHTWYIQSASSPSGGDSTEEEEEKESNERKKGILSSIPILSQVVVTHRRYYPTPFEHYILLTTYNQFSPTQFGVTNPESSLARRHASQMSLTENDFTKNFLIWLLTISYCTTVLIGQIVKIVKTIEYNLIEEFESISNKWNSLL